MSDAQAEQSAPLPHRKTEILSVRRQVLRRSSRLAVLADKLGGWLGSAVFLVVLVAFHVGWVVWNSGLLEVPRFDEPPFPRLAVLASVEAPLLTTMILMHQRREQRIAELREEAEMQVALHTERELTKTLQLVADLHEAMKLDPRRRGRELSGMEEYLDPERLFEELSRMLAEKEKAGGIRSRG